MLMWQTEWKERSDRAQEQISLTRRSIYVFTTTFACFAMVAFINWSGATTSLAEKTVVSLLSFAETMGMFYVGASVIDRSKLLTKVGEGWSQGKSDAAASGRSKDN